MARAPLIIGEFGEDPRVEGSSEYYKDYFNFCDRHNIGWVYWSYDLERDNDKYAFLDSILSMRLKFSDKIRIDYKR